MLIATPDINSMTFGGEMIGGNSLAKGKVRIPGMGAQFHQHLGLEVFDKPEGQGDMTDPIIRET